MIPFVVSTVVAVLTRQGCAYEIHVVRKLCRIHGLWLGLGVWIADCWRWRPVYRYSWVRMYRLNRLEFERMHRSWICGLVTVTEYVVSETDTAVSLIVRHGLRCLSLELRLKWGLRARWETL